jgi:hypothetical protein
MHFILRLLSDIENKAKVHRLVTIVDVTNALRCFKHWNSEILLFPTETFKLVGQKDSSDLFRFRVAGWSGVSKHT